MAMQSLLLLKVKRLAISFWSRLHGPGPPRLFLFAMVTRTRDYPRTTTGTTPVLRRVRMSFTSGLLDFPFAQDRHSCFFVRLASQHGVAAATLCLGLCLNATHSITRVFLLTP